MGGIGRDNKRIAIGLIILSLVLIIILFIRKNYSSEIYQRDFLEKYCRYSGEGVKIAIIDSGIIQEYEEKVEEYINFTDSLDKYDENGHGTYMYRIIHDDQIGIAKKAEIYVLKVTDKQCNGISSSIISAI